MKNVLLPTDFSQNAWNALFTALKMYAEFECKFYLLHAYEPAAPNLTGFKSSIRAGKVYDALHEVSQTKLAEIAQYLKENHSNPNHYFETISYPGDLITAVKDGISNHDIEAIVMGTTGATGAKGIFMGSNTVKVLKTIKNCVIVTVPEQFDFKALKTVVLPTEYAHFFPRHVLLPVVELAAPANSEIKVFHVAQEFQLSEHQEANKSILKKRLESVNHSFYKVTIKTTVTQAIREFSETEKADLIVLTNYSHTLLEKLTQEPVVKKVAFKSTIPLMVLPDFEG